ncbi:MAG TPA: FeoB-associated Cys-rich membrane protein [Pyrinomonadaceae bacterium]|jgi:hypothetical protein
MLRDWQNVAVLLIVLAALVYVGRRGLARVRGLVGRGKADASCATGCGACGPAEAPRPVEQTVVQITRSGRGQAR